MHYRISRQRYFQSKNWLGSVIKIGLVLLLTANVYYKGITIFDSNMDIVIILYTLRNQNNRTVNKITEK